MRCTLSELNNLQNNHRLTMRVKTLMGVQTLTPRNFRAILRMDKLNAIFGKWDLPLQLKMVFDLAGSRDYPRCRACRRQNCCEFP